MTRRTLTDEERIASIREVVEATHGDWHEATALYSVGADLNWLLKRIEDEAASPVPAPTLDAAWQEAEAALPPNRYDAPDYDPDEGGPSLRVESHAFVGLDHCQAVAFSEGYTVAAKATGPTPAAALHALALALATPDTETAE